MWRRVWTALAFAVLLAGCSVPGSPPPASSSPSVVPPPTTSPTPAPTVNASPSSSPSPSAAVYGPIGTPEPTGAALVIHQDWSDTGPVLDRTVVLADGRVVRMVIEPERPIVVEERLLSARGLELVLAAVDANPLFERSQTRAFVASPPACCGAGDAIKLVRDGREVTVGRMLMPPEVYAPSAAWDDFERLLGRLDALETWLPADAWTQRKPQPFAAPAYRLRVEASVSPDPPLGPIAWPAGFDPTSFGVAGPDSPGRCGIVAPEIALAISRQADALRAAQGRASHPTLAEAALYDGVVAGTPDGRSLALSFNVLLPHQVTTDAGVCGTGW